MAGDRLSRRDIPRQTEAEEVWRKATSLTLDFPFRVGVPFPRKVKPFTTIGKENAA